MTSLTVSNTSTVSTQADESLVLLSSPSRRGTHLSTPRSHIVRTRQTHDQALSSDPFQSPLHVTPTTIVNRDNVIAAAAVSRRQTIKNNDRAKKIVIDLSLDSSPFEFGSVGDGALIRGATGRTDRRHNAVTPQGSPLKDRPWLKYRSPSELEKLVNHASTGRTSAASRAKTVMEHMTSRHFNAPLQESRAIEEEINNVPGRQAALQRRKDWTPPKVILPLSPELSSEPLSTAALGARNLLEKLKTDYTHVNSHSDNVAPVSKTDGMILGKRKAVQTAIAASTVTSRNASRSISPDKSRAIKKKPRTLTELATAPFAPPAEPDTSQARLTDFALPIEEEPTSARANGKRNAKSRRKVALRKQQPKLLSPTSATRASAGQDFVFGTSSQLITDASPGFLRDLHVALRASNTAGEHHFDGDDEVSQGGDAAARPLMKRMWSESARDGGGNVSKIDVINLSSSPSFPEDDAFVDPSRILPTCASRDRVEDATRDTSVALQSVTAADSHPIESHETAASLSMKRLQPSPKLPKSSSANVIAIASDDEVSVPPSNQEQSQEMSQEGPAAAVASSLPRPKFELMTDAQLTKRISKYGFKPVKPRTAQIALLDRCWRSQRPTSATTSMTSAALSTRSPAKFPANSQPRDRAKMDAYADASETVAGRPRGRPKKVAQKTNADEIASVTTTADLNAAPPNRRGRPKKIASVIGTDDLAAVGADKPKPASTPMRKTSDKKLGKPVAKVAATADVASDLESSSDHVFTSPENNGVSFVDPDAEISLLAGVTVQETEVADLITKAVLSEPRTVDSSKPSWHERMLMYDPVILETFTAWLNSGQLTKLGYDGEIAPNEVKKWCESKSICCLWQIGYHGKERKRL